MLVAHISDTHFTVGPLAAIPSRRGHEALSRVQALDPRPDCVVLTGDLVDRGEPAEYALALEILQSIDLPIHVVPGNHDDSSRLLEALTDTGHARRAPQEPDRCYYRVDYPDLRLLCCDSSIPGVGSGELGDAQLDWLDSELARGRDVRTFVAMHHHPMPTGIRIMDTVMLKDADKLAAVLWRHGGVDRILIGHLHRNMSAVFAGSLVSCAPSTYRQVFLDLTTTDHGAFVDEPPGLLLHCVDKDRPTVTHYLPITHSGPPAGRIG